MFNLVRCGSIINLLTISVKFFWISKPMNFSISQSATVNFNDKLAVKPIDN